MSYATDDADMQSACEILNAYASKIASVLAARDGSSLPVAGRLADPDHRLVDF